MRSGMDRTVLLGNYTIPRKRSPDGVTTACCGRNLTAAYYSLIDPKRMKG